jgi:hypothetical protein
MPCKTHHTFPWASWMAPRWVCSPRSVIRTSSSDTVTWANVSPASSPVARQPSSAEQTEPTGASPTTSRWRACLSNSKAKRGAHHLGGDGHLDESIRSGSIRRSSPSSLRTSESAKRRDPDRNRSLNEIEPAFKVSAFVAIARRQDKVGDRGATIVQPPHVECLTIQRLPFGAQDGVPFQQHAAADAGT